jgi:hypothetical protein
MATELANDIATALTVKHDPKVSAIVDNVIDDVLNSVAEYTNRGWSQDLIADTLIANLTNPNSPVFGPQIQQLENQWNSLSANQRSLNQALVWPDNTIYVWICISDKASCPHCLARHGQRGTLAEMTERGLPGDEWAGGGPQCGYNCRCYLVASNEYDDSLKNPIVMDGKEELTREELLGKLIGRKSFDTEQLKSFIEVQGLPPLPN